MTDRETVTTPSIEATRAVMPERVRVRMEDGVDCGGFALFSGFVAAKTVPSDVMPFIDESSGACLVPAGMERAFLVDVFASTGAAMSGRIAPIDNVGVAYCYRSLVMYGDESWVVVDGDGGHTVVVVKGGATVAVIRPQVTTHEPVMHDGRQLGTVAHTPDLDIHGRTWGTGADPMGLRITTPYDGTEGTQAAQEVL